MPITKHNYIVKDPAELADTIREAFYIANEGRKGPVLIDIPKDITGALMVYEKKEPKKVVNHNPGHKRGDSCCGRAYKEC